MTIKKQKSSITVFLTLIFLCFVLVLGSIIDLVRIATVGTQIDRALNSAMLSTLAGYSRELKSDYGLLFMAVTEEEIQKQLIKEYMEQTLNPKDHGADAAGFNLYRYNINQIEINHTIDKRDFSLSNAALVEEQILEYVRFQAPVGMVGDIIGGIEDGGKVDAFISIIKGIIQLGEETLADIENAINDDTIYTGFLEAVALINGYIQEGDAVHTFYVNRQFDNSEVYGPDWVAYRDAVKSYYVGIGHLDDMLPLTLRDANCFLSGSGGMRAFINEMKSNYPPLPESYEDMFYFDNHANEILNKIEAYIRVCKVNVDGTKDVASEADEKLSIVTDRLLSITNESISGQIKNQIVNAEPAFRHNMMIYGTMGNELDELLNLVTSARYDLFNVNWADLDTRAQHYDTVINNYRKVDIDASFLIPDTPLDGELVDPDIFEAMLNSSDLLSNLLERGKQLIELFNAIRTDLTGGDTIVDVMSTSESILDAGVVSGFINGLFDGLIGMLDLLGGVTGFLRKITFGLVTPFVAIDVAVTIIKTLIELAKLVFNIFYEMITFILKIAGRLLFNDGDEFLKELYINYYAMSTFKSISTVNIGVSYDKKQNLDGYELSSEDDRLDYELEYILFGNTNEAKNAQRTRALVLGIRLAFNMAYMFLDKQVTVITAAIAAVVCNTIVPGLGSAAIPAVKVVLKCLWAALETAVEYGILVLGGNVSMIKFIGQGNLFTDPVSLLNPAIFYKGTEGDIVGGLDGLLDKSIKDKKDKLFLSIEENDWFSLDVLANYDQHLFFLLLSVPIERKVKRIINVINHNYVKSNGGSVHEIVAGMEVEATVRVGMMFLNQSWVRKANSRLTIPYDRAYEYKVEWFQAY